MHYLKIIPFSLYMAGMLALTGCSSDAPESPEVSTPDGQEFWVQFEISNPVESAVTRATSSNTPKTDTEAIISDLIVMLFDTDASGKATFVRGIASGNKVIKTQDATNKAKYTVKANMGLHSMFMPQGDEEVRIYKLCVFANLPSYANLTNLYDQSLLIVGAKVVSPLNILTSETLSSKGLPMSSMESDMAKVQVKVTKTITAGQDKTYKAEAVNSSDDGTLMLTPLYARVDFVKNSTYPDFAYPISYKTGESTSVTEVKVQFTHAALKNAATKVNLLPNAALDMNGTALRSPSNMTFSNSSALVMQTSAPFLYLPEFVPTVSSSKLSFVETTYIELYAKLVADDTCNLADDVKTAINQASTSKTASPKLYYYDDGTSQSSLTTVSHAGEANWTELSYDATVDGYKLTYRHAIRHNTNGSDDGIINQQEYGVVRNYIYNIGIASVSSLPHQWADTENVENKRDVVLHITPHNWAKRTQNVDL